MTSVGNKEFINKTIFFAPIWTDNYNHFVDVMKSDPRYFVVEKNECPQYLLPYITEIYNNDELYMEFELLSKYIPKINTFEEELNLLSTPEIQKIRVVCFSTGCVFMEFYVEYRGLSLNQIIDFAYLFKNATYSEKNDSDKITLEKAIEELILENANAKKFFASADFKKECKMFHQIRLENTISSEELKERLLQLSRGYHKDFSMPNLGGEFDMIFEPYAYDHWAGSQEGFVNVFEYSGNERTNRFLKKYKASHLDRNYRFMYLVLLNQRFSAINYLEKTAMVHKYTRKEKEKLNHDTSFLKTTFSFSVVSDDRLYQTIYSNMYSVLGIEKLLIDIRDNEEQLAVVRNHEMLESEKMTSRFLFSISLLSLFSALVDAAGYFDRFLILKGISTILSFICLAVILIFYLVWWLNYKKK